MSTTKHNDPTQGWDCRRCDARNGAHRKDCWYCGDKRPLTTS